MRIGLIAPPFIPLPPPRYGGTELFVSQLALGLKGRGADLIVYTVGESTLEVPRRWLYERSDWPVTGDLFSSLRDLDHNLWAVYDASHNCDVIHVNGVPGVAATRFLRQPAVYTVHHAYEEPLTEFYRHHPRVHYVFISDFQREQAKVTNGVTIYHGVDMSLYQAVEKKRDYLTFLGRIAPVKGVHLAIEVARKAGLPLKIAGQIQPAYQSYYDTQVKPHLDGKFIEYVGEADLAMKNELLGNSRAMLFPIQWHEPFGLVMVEAMACGTPVLALPGGSVPEVVQEGIAGHICASVEEMAEKVRSLNIPSRTVRAYVETNFSVATMVDRYMRLYRDLIDEPAVITESGARVA